MNVWRKQTVRYVDDHGKRVTKTTRGAKRITESSKRFYGTLRLANGKRKQQPLTEDKQSSLTLLRRLQTNEDEKRANGITEDVERRQTPILDVLRDYESYLRSKGNTDEYVRLTMVRLTKLIRSTKTTTLDDLDVNRILKTLSDWRQRKRQPISAGTSNHYVTVIKGFSRWTWTERIVTSDPLVGLRKQNADVDRRRIRRPLTPDEFETLTRVTQQSDKRYLGNDWQFTATDRAMLYWTAAYTGLRAKELASLTKTSFDSDNMTWTLSANASKNGKAVTLPLSKTLAAKLLPWFDTLKRETLWPGSWAVKRMGGKMLKRDLKRCGIAYEDDQGRYVDFHALRHTFITSLAKAGVHPSKAQRLARHSSITLTMNVYTSLNVDDLRDGVDAI